MLSQLGRNILLTLVAALAGCATRQTTNEQLGPSTKSCYAIDGMTCGSCAQKITDEIKKQPSVYRVEVSLKNESAEIESALGSPPINVEKIIDRLGYRAKIQACEKN